MSTAVVSTTRRNQTKEFIESNWPRILVSFLLIAVFFGNQGFRSLVRNYLELRSLRSDIAALETQEKNASERLKLLKSGDGSVERLARRELGYVRKGEIEYRFPPPLPEK